MTGGYLAVQVKTRILRPIAAFREYIFLDVLPAFGNLSQRADKVANEHYRAANLQPLSDDEYPDMGEAAEDAYDRGSAWYEMMTSLRQTMLNLLATGLFHLTEQQLLAVCLDGGFTADPPELKLDPIGKWYEKNLHLDLKSLPSYARLDELRHVANTVKHAEGAAKKLRSMRPELFTNPTFANIHGCSGKSILQTDTVRAPLAGNDLFVTEAALRSYAEAAENLFEEVAAHFEAHADTNFN